MPHIIVAVRAVAMSIDLSTPQPTRQICRKALLQLLEELRRWLPPHLLGAVALFMWLGTLTAGAVLAHFPSQVQWVGTGLILGGYSLAALGYAGGISCVFALRAACMGWNDFIADIIDLVQNRLAQQVEDWEMGVSKPQALHLMQSSVKEVFTRVSGEESLPRWLTWIGLGLVAWVVRRVLTAKITRLAGRSVQWGKLFAGKMSLAGAVFLNLHLLTGVLLFVGYAVGLAVAGLNIYFVFLIK